jgi:hypothetical protein
MIRPIFSALKIEGVPPPIYRVSNFEAKPDFRSISHIRASRNAGCSDESVME